jgi:hypothetical protein
VRQRIGPDPRIGAATMPHRFLRTRLVLIAVFALTVMNCGGGAPTGDIDKIAVVQSQFDVSLTNTSGKALFEVKAEIEPVGPATHYSTIIPRMENGEKRVIAHNLFTDRDGIPFSARNVKASKITVTAKDIDNKALSVVMAWKK